MKLHEWAQRTHRAITARLPEERQRHFTMADVEEILRTSIDVLTLALEAGEDLRVDNLGRLWVEDKPPRIVANNLDGKTHRFKVGRRRNARFRPSARLSRRLNSPE